MTRARGIVDSSVPDLASNPGRLAGFGPDNDRLDGGLRRRIIRGNRRQGFRFRLGIGLTVSDSLSFAGAIGQAEEAVAADQAEALHRAHEASGPDAARIADILNSEHARCVVRVVTPANKGA